MKPTFNQEVMLAGWSETHNGGAKVTFWLADSASLESFKAMTVAKGKTAGQRLAMCLVEIGDDEQPKEPIEPEEQKGGLLSQWLALRCKEFNFWVFIQTKSSSPNLIVSYSSCDYEVKLFLGIKSKKELDNDKEAENRFHEMIRIPYAKYLAGAR